MSTSSEYTSENIQSLSAHQHLLKRMNLTFSDEKGSESHPFSSQKTSAVREIQENSIDEVLGGHGTHVKVSFFKDFSIQVDDNGRGIPVDSSKDSLGRNVSGIYKALGIIQSGGKFGKKSGSDNYTLGTNGVGSSSCIHLSKMAVIKVYRNKKVYELHFKDGTPGFFTEDDNPDSTFTPLDDDKYDYLRVSKDTRSKEEKSLYPTGTSVRVWLNDSVFQSPYPVDTADLAERLKATCYRRFMLRSMTRSASLRILRLVSRSLCMSFITLRMVWLSWCLRTSVASRSCPSLSILSRMVSTLSATCL